MQAKRIALERIKIFASLPDASKGRIMEVAGLQRFAAGNLLFVEGEVPQFVYALASGSIAFSAGRGARRQVIEFLGPGEAALLPAVILDKPYLISCHAIAPGEMLLIPADTFRALLAELPSLAAICARQIAEHWRLLVAQLKDMRLRTPTERLAAYLIANATLSGTSGNLTLKLMKKDLAERLGMVPETLSRAFQRLRAHGVRAEGSEIVITDSARLNALVEEQPEDD